MGYSFTIAEHCWTARQVALVHFKLEPVRLRQVVRRDFHLHPEVSKAVDGLERIQGRRLAVPAEHRSALVAETSDVRDHENRALSPDARTRRAAV